MKTLLLAAFVTLSVMSATAQKIAYINTDDLMAAMPESKKADADLKEYENALAQQGDDLGKAADEQAKKFVKDSATFSETVKEIKRKAIMEMYQKSQDWPQTARAMYNQKAQALADPIRVKALDAIKVVAKEKGYVYVLDASVNVLLVSPAGDDLLPAVKAKLGIVN